MFAFGYINNNLLNHLLHSNKYGMFVQAIYQLDSYVDKHYTGKYYLNLIFFFPVLNSLNYQSFENFILALLYLFIIKLCFLSVVYILVSSKRVPDLFLFALVNI